MKCIQFFFVGALLVAFLPTPVEGTVGILIFSWLFLDWAYKRIADRIFFTDERNERDCQSVMLSTGLNITDDTEECNCYTDGYTSFYVTLTCPEVNDTICFSPSDEKFCSQRSSYYIAESTERVRLTVNTSPLIASESIYISVWFNESGFDFSNIFRFTFERGDGATSSSKKYTSCSVLSRSSEYDEYEKDCTSCDICDNGLDFKYDCSNVNGTYAYDNVKDKIALFPGPKVNSCFPVVNVFPTFTS